MLARDIDGRAVASSDSSAVFFYDTTLDVTWLRNMNTPNAPLGFASAKAWADGLTTGGFTDWRLPTLVDTNSPGCNLSYSGGTDCGANVQTKSGDPLVREVGQTIFSEMAHLFYVTLGNVTAYNADHSVKPGLRGVDWGLVNTAHFDNMQIEVYWSDTQPATGPDMAWVFGTDDGLQFYGPINGPTDAPRFVAVLRSGDVLAVPEPGTLALLALGLAGLGYSRRKQ